MSDLDILFPVPTGCRNADGMGYPPANARALLRGNARESSDSAMSALTAGLCVGARVKLLKSIYDDGEDHHPPGRIAQAGEVLIVKEVREDSLAVAHEGNPGAFRIYHGEYETHKANVTGLAPAQETTK